MDALREGAPDHVGDLLDGSQAVGIAAAGGDVRKVRPQAGEESLAEAVQTTRQSPSVFDGPHQMDFKSAIAVCTSYKHTGCVLAWWLIQGTVADGLIFQVPQGIRSYTGITAAANLSAARRRNSVFPFREGELETFIGRFKEFSLEEIATSEVVEQWHEDAWLFNCVTALNKLAGYKGSPYPGRWTSSEHAAAGSMRRAIRRRCARDVAMEPMTEAQWQKELGSRHVGYNGEEVSVCNS
eukprot:s1280_g3.t1